jgi:diguanylate cyclase (GGDEF)-like protein
MNDERDGADTVSMHRRNLRDRRQVADRRMVPTGEGGIRHATWAEQKIQFATRFFFIAMGVLFFNLATDFRPSWMTLTQINAFFALMALINSFNFWHASRHLYNTLRYRAAMWVDIIGVSVGVLNDPYEIPPTLIVYILVVLGNGMRYGMPFFAEAVVGSIVSGILALVLRLAKSGVEITPGMAFLSIFAVTVLVYAYILMSRIETSRRSLERTSHIDMLTGLMNRRALLAAADELFDRVNARGGRLVLLFADMDRFKSVNDGAGHAVGDQVLQRIGAILRESIRGGDVAARYGGDEFVILLDGATLDEGEQIARRIQQAVKDYARSEGFDFSVTIALGEAPTHGSSIDALMDRVDEALYRCKTHRGSIGRAEPAADAGAAS